MTRRKPIRKRRTTDRLREEARQLTDDAKGCVDKCRFLVRRGEFLHSQALMFNAQAAELVADAQRSGTDVSKLLDRCEILEANIENRALGRKPKTSRRGPWPRIRSARQKRR